MSLNRLRKGSLDRPQHPYSPPHQQLAYDQQQSTGQLPYHTMSQADHRDSASEGESLGQCYCPSKVSSW